jgi:hypothetical protein
MDAGPDPTHFRDNQLSIVTFNYDRSFERALFLFLKHSYGLSDNDAEALRRWIPVVHVHGQLGCTPYQPIERVEGAIDPLVLREAAATIKIVHESAEEDPEFREARQLMWSTQVVCLLGFGYHRANIERLQLMDLSQNVRLVGSAYGVYEGERRRIERVIRRPIELGSRNLDALNYLRETPVFV